MKHSTLIQKLVGKMFKWINNKIVAKNSLKGTKEVNQLLLQNRLNCKA